jgi:hypothetical protein
MTDILTVGSNLSTLIATEESEIAKRTRGVEFARSLCEALVHAQKSDALEQARLSLAWDYSFQRPIVFCNFGSTRVDECEIGGLKHLERAASALSDVLHIHFMYELQSVGTIGPYTLDPSMVYWGNHSVMDTGIIVMFLSEFHIRLDSSPYE